MQFFRLRTAKLEKARLEVELAKLKLLDMQLRFRPHCNVPVNVVREGSRWVCIFEGDPDPLKCVVAYGESPAQACSNFDSLWNGASGFILQDDDEEEEQF